MDTGKIMGTETWWKHPIFRSYTYTDKAYWLIDAILSHQGNKKVSKQEFQVWKLTKQGDESWILACEDGNNHKVVDQVIQFSDFPLNTITIWLTDRVLLLPSEY